MEGVAAERTLRFLVKIDADLDEAERALQELRVLLQSIDNTNAEAMVGVDGVEAAMAEVQALADLIDSLDNKTIELSVEIDFDPEQFLARLNDLMQSADQTVMIDIDINDDSYDRIHDFVQGLSERETAHIQIALDVDREQLKGIQDLISSVGDDQKITVHIDLETIGEDLQQMRDRIAAETRRVTIPVGFDIDLSDVEEIRIAVRNVSEMSGYARIGVIESALTDSNIRDLKQKLQDFANNEYQAKLTIDSTPAYTELREFESRAHIGDIRVVLDVADLVGLAKINHFKEQLQEIERTWTAVLDVDNKSALDKIRYFLKRLDEVSAAMGTAHLDADATAGNVTINNITNNVKEYGRMRESAKLGVDSREAKAELAGFQAIINRYQNRWGGTQGIRARITADINQALVNIRILNHMLESVEDDTRRVIIEAEITKALAELETLRSAADAVGAQDPTVTASVRGAAVAVAELLGLQAVADRLDGTNASIQLDVDDRLSRALPNILGAFELQLQNFQTIATTATAVGVQGMIASLAAVPAAAAAAAGAVGSLTTTIVPGLVGALGAVGGAAAGSVIALGAFGLAIKSAGSFTWGLSQNLRQQAYQTKAAKDAVDAAKTALEQATPGTQDYTNKQRALTLATINYNNEAKNNAILMESVTPTIIKLARKYADLSNEVTRLKASMADAVAPFLIVFFNAIDTAINKIEPGLHEMISSMGQVASKFVQSYESGKRLTQITTILQSIADIGPNAMKILTNGLDIFIGLASQIAPTSAKIVGYIADMTTKANEWVHSAEGQNRIAQIWQHMMNVAKQLWQIALDLAKGLWGVVAALGASSTGPWLLDQIQKGAHWFAQLMSASGDARGAITDFVNDTKPLLIAAGQLIAEVVKGIMHLIQVVHDEQGESGKPFGVLIDVLNALKQTVPEVVELLVHEFKTIGPLLPDLIKAIGEWATLFQRSTPEMVVFIKTITHMLEMFNALPEPLKILIARSLAWAAAIKILGGGALLGIAGSLADLAFKMILINKVWGKGPGVLARVGGAFSKIKGALSGLGPALASVGGKLRGLFDDIALRAMYAFDKIKAAVPRLLGSLRSIGPAIRTAFAGIGGGEAAIAGGGAAALLGGWFLEIQQFRNETIPKLKEIGPELHDAVRKGMETGDWSDIWEPLAQAAGEIARMQSPAGAVTKWLMSPIDRLLKNWGIDIEWPWEQRENSIENSIRAIPKIGPFFSNLWKGIKDTVGPAWNQIKQAVGSAAQGVASAAKAAWTAIKPAAVAAWNGIKGALLAVWNALKPAATAAWNAIKNTVLSAVRGIGSALSPIWNSIKSGALAAWNGLKGAASTVWNAIKTVIRAVVYTTVGLVLLAWDQIKPRLLAAWNGIKAAAGSAWNAIRGVIASAWNRVKAIFGPALTFIKNVIATAWAATKNSTQQAWNAVWGFLKGIWNRIKSIFQGGGGISQLLQAAWQRVRSVTTAVWNAIKNFLQSVWNQIKGAVAASLAVTRNVIQRGWNAIKGVTTTVWNAVKNAVRNAWNAIKQVAGPAINAIRNAVRNGWNTIKNATTQAWNAIKNAVRNAWNAIKGVAGPAINAIRNAVRNGWNSIKNLTSQVWGAIRNFLRNVWNQIKQIAGPAINAIRNAVRNGWNSIKNLTSQVWGAIRNFFRNVWNQIKAVVNPAVNAIRNAVRNGWNSIRNLTTSVWNAIKNAFRNAWNAIKAVVGPAVSAIRNQVQQGWNAVKNATVSVWNQIKAAFQRAWQQIKATVGPAVAQIRSAVVNGWNTIRNATTSAWNTIKNAIQNAWNAIKGAVSTAVNAVRNVITGAWNQIKSATITAWNGIKNAVSSGWTAIRNAIMSGINSVASALKQWAANMVTMGKNAIIGLINGIKSQAGAVGTAIYNLLRDAYNRGKQAIEQGSPSKLFHRDIGEPISMGVAGGIVAKTRDVIAAISAMTRAMFERARQGVDAMRALGSAAIQAGHMIVAGLTRGVGEASAQLIARMRQIAQAALNAARSTLQIRSPSRPMVQYGIETIRGLIVGADRMFGPMRDTIVRLLQQAVFGPIDDSEPRNLGELVSTAAHLRQQQRATQATVRSHRMIEDSYTRMVRTMIEGSRASVDAMRSMEMQAKRNAALRASMGGGRAAGVGAAFHATPPQVSRQQVGLARPISSRVEHHVYVHTDGPAAGEIDNQDLADRITQNLHRERRRN